MNHIEIDIENGLEIQKDDIDLINKSINRVCEIENLTFGVYVSVTLTDKKRIKEINFCQRGIDKETDVLSFPYLLFDSNGKLKDKLTQADYHPEFNAVYLGDMVICFDIVKEQAEENEHSFQRELAYLTVHSMYHLLGYDHEDKALKCVMRKKEEDALKEIF